MLLLFEIGIRGGMYHVTHNYAKANDKYMKNYDKNKESLFLTYVDANNLHGWAMSKKLLIDGFKWVDDLSMFTEDFINNCDEESDTGYLLVLVIIYPIKIRMSHRYLPFLPEKMKIKKCSKLVCNLNDKENFNSYSCIKTSIKSWFKTENGTSCYQFQARALVKAIY